MSAERPMKRTSSLVKRQNTEDEDRSLRTRLTESQADEEASSLPPVHPSSDKKASIQRPGRFKAVSQLVVAMNRFKASLNPTYTFGKRSESGNSLGLPRDSQESDSQEIDTLQSAPTENLEAQKVYSTRGHKTNYLLRPLPPAANEAHMIA